MAELDDKIDDKPEAKEPALRVQRKEPAIEGTGVTMTRRRVTEYAPPLKDRTEEDYQAALGDIDKQDQKLSGAVRGKVPILASTVRIPLRFEGDFLSTTTGWDGWKYTEEEMDDIWLLVQSLGLEATPAIQLFGIIIGLHGAKLAGFMAWKRRGGKRGGFVIAPDKDKRDEKEVAGE